MMELADRLAAALLEGLPVLGLGRTYTVGELLGHCPDACEADIAMAVATGRIELRYRGGWTGVPVALDRPNRHSTLHRISPTLFVLDTEAGIQAGARLWFQERHWIAREEIPDSERVWSELALTCDLSRVRWDSRRAGTSCRDLVGQRCAGDPRIELWEAKGKTAVEGDLYETFGQIFPIADPSVTRGWTNNRVPKHGLGLKWAELLAARWATAHDARIAVAVLVPDFPPPEWELGEFYEGPSRYYTDQAAMFARFVAGGNADGERAFPRLLRHLRDQYALLARIRGKAGIRFRFLGFQSTRYIRDFATGGPLVLDGAGE